MRKVLVSTVAAATLIAVAGLARAQSTGQGGAGESSNTAAPNVATSPPQSGPSAKGTNLSQGRSAAEQKKQRLPRINTPRQGRVLIQYREEEGKPGMMGKTPMQQERQPGTMEQSPTQGRSATEQRQQERQPGTMEKSPTQGRSATEQRQQEHQPGTMEKSPTQGRSSAEQRKEHQQPGVTEKSPTQGRSATEERRERQPGAMEKGQGRPMAGQNRPGEPRAAQTPRGRAGMAQAPGGMTEHRSVAAARSVTLNSQQKSNLQQVVTGGQINRVEHADFNIAVGAVIPSSVALYPVPEQIVEIVPQYRGFDYIVVGDDLLIIDPGTLEIVAVVPV